MSTTKPFSDEPCPVARSVQVIGDRWSLLLVRDAFDGVRRFSDFQRNLGMARNILSDRLRRLVDTGIFVTRPSSEGGAYQEYVLTEAGKRLFPVLVALRQWGEQELFAAGEPHSELIEKNTGKPLQTLAPRSEDGKLLQPEDTVVRKLPTGTAA